jgi:hypothetical protein
MQQRKGRKEQTAKGAKEWGLITSFFATFAFFAPLR